MKKNNTKCPKNVLDALNNNKNQFDKEFMDTLYEMCDEDVLKYKFKEIDKDDTEDEIESIQAENFDELDKMKDNYDEIDIKIADTEQGESIYRGYNIQDYKSFVNGLTFVGETLDRWVGKKPTKHPNLGIFWTWDKKCARLEGSCNTNISKNLVILKGIKPTSIDEKGTHITNINYDNLEKEIRLNENSSIFVEEVCRHVKINKKQKLKEICEPLKKTN